MAKRMLIAGGSGLIGSALKEEATKQGYEVILLSRSRIPDSITWDPERHTIDIEHPIFFDAIINLAGASISSGRWTKKRKYELLKSRLDSAKTLAVYLTDGRLTTYCYVGASAYGIYGDHGNDWVDEFTPVENSGWLIDLVIQWEEAHRAIEALGIRTIIARFSIVCSMEGGALKELLKFARFGVMAYLGNGRQYWPWIHIDDACRMVLHCIHNEDCQGIYFVATPNPVQQREIMLAANRQYNIHRIIVPAPVFGLRLLLGQMHRPMMESCRGKSMRLEEAGYRFLYPNIEEAMGDLLGK